MTNSIPPIVQDYWEKLDSAAKAKSAETKRRLKREAYEILSVMTAKAAQLAVDRESESK